MYYNKFTRHEQVRLITLRFEREKYLSKRSLIKHTCSWRVNLLYYEHWTDKQKYCTLVKTRLIENHMLLQYNGFNRI